MRKNSAEKALKQMRQAPPQTRVEIVKGFSIRRTSGGIPVVREHYSSDPDRDPEIHPEWKATERKTYTSQGAWDREQEIIDNAGGGELVVADVLITHWNKIVITSPEWRPDKRWRVEGGFDHGKTNPTALERAYIDFDGTIIFCGEYYMPGLEVWEHCPSLREMADVRKIAACYADPTIFDATMQQSNQPAQAGKAAERAKSINDLYYEGGIGLFSPFAGDRSDISFAARLHMHWSNLDQREPSLKIVCRNYAEKPQPGLHNWDCPNLLWELMRMRRLKLSAQQMLVRNVSEAIVDKDNHARDATKYLIMSHPEPTLKSFRERAKEALKDIAEQGDLTSAYIRYKQLEDEEKRNTEPVRIGRYRPNPRYRYRPRR
jgi:hypothetical protein